MSAARAGSLGIVAVAAALLATGAWGKNVPSTTYVDKTGGYSITIPTTWKLVPRTIPQVKALAARLKKKKATAELASTYTSIISSTGGKSGLKAYRFQAFDWPQTGSTPLLAEVSVGVVKTTKAYGPASLAAIGAEYANSLSANTGSKITVPKRVTLPVGPAEFIEGTIPAGSGLSNGIELYLIPHGKRLYELSFQVDAKYLRQATLFTAIARLFKFV
jgi:hypothetical protein